MDIWQYGAMKADLFEPKVVARVAKPVFSMGTRRLSIYQRLAIDVGEGLIWLGSQIKQHNQMLTDQTFSPGAHFNSITIE